MSGGHAAADGLYVPRRTLLHSLPAHGKLLALVAFVIVVVSTPAGSWAVFAVYATLLAGVVALAKLPATLVARRMVVETPFVVFAAILPFVATGPQVEVAGLHLSTNGLIGGGTLLIKGTLGVVAAIILAATTQPRDLLAGLDRLRLPHMLVAILSFMIRYASVVADDLRRMRVARESRGYTGGRVAHLAAVAAGAGTLFVRGYERGERVHMAMLARGYTGRMPALASAKASPFDWACCALLPLSALAVLLAGHVISSGGPS